MQWIKFSISLATLLFSSQLVAQQPIKVDYSKWSLYANSIEQCSPGQFSLPDPLKVAQTRIRSNNVEPLNSQQSGTEQAIIVYKIYGFDQNRRCRVIIQDQTAVPTPSSSPVPYGQECYFSAQDLLQLANTARKIASGQFASSTDDPDANTKGVACKERVPSLPELPPPPEKNTRWGA